jgi:hypothetical protein
MHCGEVAVMGCSQTFGIPEAFQNENPQRVPTIAYTGEPLCHSISETEREVIHEMWPIEVRVFSEEFY